MMRKLFNHDSAAGNGAPAIHEQNPPAPAPAATPAADTVINAEITEDTVRLKKDLEDTKAKLKQRETEHASVTDEFTRYKDATEARNEPVPVPVRKKTPEEKPFRIGRFV